MKRALQIRPASGFTLVELVLSVSLMSLILGAAYACMQAGYAGRETLEIRSEAAQKARVALELLGADLRAATPLSRDFEFLGMRRMIEDAPADNLDFATRHYTPRAEREGDFCEVSYYVDKNPETGRLDLWRRRDPTPDMEPLGGGAREEILEGLVGLRFEYYDGFEWFDEWGDPQGKRRNQDTAWQETNLSGLPEAVRVTLRFAVVEPAPNRAENLEAEEETEPATLDFETVIRLNLAPLIRASVGGSSEATENGAAEAPAQGRPPEGGRGG